MGKKSWFSLIKRLFRWDTQSEHGKKEKRREWIYGRMKVKRLTPIAVASKETTMLGEEDEEQRKNALSVEENSAAIRIQAAFRGYLARKALRALKGIVKLQAIIRGRAVRRQALRSLKCLQSIVSIQSKVSASRRLQLLEATSLHDKSQQGFHDSRDKIIRMDSNSEKRWDDSILLKEEVETSCMSKKEALLRRERMKQYSFNHRMSAETERNKVNGRWRYWLEQWVDTQLSKSKELEDLDTTAFTSHYFNKGEKDNNEGGKGIRSLKQRNPHQRQKNQIEEEGLNCHRRHCSSVGREEEEENYSVFTASSPVIPTYMAPTESAKAKARSISSPRLRVWNNNLETDSDYSYNSPCKKKLPLVSSSVNSTASEVFGSSTRIGRLSGSNYKQISPRLKGTVASVMNKV